MDVGLWIVASRSIPRELADLLRADPSRPLITQIWADGQRAELSVRTFENNVAKAANLLQDDRIFSAFRNSLFLAVMGATVCVTFAALISYLTVKTKVAGRGLLEALAFIPWAFPGTALAIGILWAYINFPIPIYATVSNVSGPVAAAPSDTPQILLVGWLLNLLQIGRAHV